MGATGQSPLVETPNDLEIWQARERDGKSWRDIGDEFFPRLKVEARRSEARRAYERVQNYMKGDPKGHYRERELRELIEEKFGVTAQEFRAFILKGRLPRRK